MECTEYDRTVFYCSIIASVMKESPLRVTLRYGYNRVNMTQLNVRLLERLLDPVSSSLNEEAARKLLNLQADAKAQRRVQKLARKCNDGELTPQERSEYETYVIAGEFIAILQAKATLLLSRPQVV